MRPSITSTLLLSLTLGASALGCRDAAPAAPVPALDNEAGSGDGDGGSAGSDSSSAAPSPPNTHAPADPSPAPDTAVRPPADRPASFALTGIIRGAALGPDTTRMVSLPGVTASLYRVRAADGTAEAEVLVATAVADALSEVVFRTLPSAYYRLDVKAPPGGPYRDGSVGIVPPPARNIAVLVVLPRKG